MNKKKALFITLLTFMFILVMFIVVESLPRTISGEVTSFDRPIIDDDSSWYFEINGTQVVIGGGWNPVPQTFDKTIKEGDRVEAKVKKNGGTLTIIDCADCYIRKIN